MVTALCTGQSLFRASDRGEGAGVGATRDGTDAAEDGIDPGGADSVGARERGGFGWGKQVRTGAARGRCGGLCDRGAVDSAPASAAFGSRSVAGAGQDQVYSPAAGDQRQGRSAWLCCLSRLKLALFAQTKVA
jgi:hypothetical protein